MDTYSVLEHDRNKVLPHATRNYFITKLNFSMCLSFAVVPKDQLVLGVVRTFARANKHHDVGAEVGLHIPTPSANLSINHQFERVSLEELEAQISSQSDAFVVMAKAHIVNGLFVL